MTQLVRKSPASKLHKVSSAEKQGKVCDTNLNNMMKSALVILSIAAAPCAAFAPSSTASHRPATDLSATTDRRAMIASTLTAAASVAASSSPALALETYLTEPTEEFKESERQRLEFRKKQLALKGEFVTVIARLTTESKTEEQLIADLNELRALVVKTGGLPIGIKKEEMYKVIRGKKAKGFWPTDVEIAYQGLKSEIRYQQSPNTEKDLENPL